MCFPPVTPRYRRDDARWVGHTRDGRMRERERRVGAIGGRDAVIDNATPAHTKKPLQI